jgi:hypothetical protein
MVNLAQLQNFCKRDPIGYKDDYDVRRREAPYVSLPLPRFVWWYFSLTTRFLHSLTFC